MHLVLPVQLLERFDFVDLARAVFPLVPDFLEDHVRMAVWGGEGGFPIRRKLQPVFRHSFELAVAVYRRRERALAVALESIPSVAENHVAGGVVVEVALVGSGE